MKYSLIFFLISIPLFGISQTLTEKVLYYDSDWKGCNENKADFLRKFKVDGEEKPIGSIKDYFISGEPQGIADGAIHIDENDDSKSIFTGKVIGYEKDGKIAFEREYDEKGNHISSKYYNENGRFEGQEYIDKNGEWKSQFVFYYDDGITIKEIVTSNEEDQMDGPYISFHRNGEINRKFNMENGEFLDRYFIECDEFGKCNRTLLEEFKNNKYEWTNVSNGQSKSEIIPDFGLRMESMTEMGFIQTIYEPLTHDEDFTIEASFEFVAGDQNSGHGIIWGMKDWDNCKYFAVSANGYYKIGNRTEGINLDSKDWSPSQHVNRSYEENSLKILKLSDKVFYSINGNLVHSEEFLNYRGNYSGFVFLSGKKNLLVKSFKIKREISELRDSEQNITDMPWLGNGSGIFIGKEYIATNYHVIEDASDIEIEYIQKGKKYNFKAIVIQSDKENDLSILKIEDSEFKSFPLKYNFMANIVDVGTSVFALGYPMALDIMGSEIKFTDGKVSAKTGYKGEISTYQTTTPIQPGNSGGPLFDYKGNLIAINSSGLSYQIAENVSYSIKVSYLKNLIDVLPESINIPSDQSICDLPLTEQIKILSEYVVLIKIK